MLSGMKRKLIFLLLWAAALFLAEYVLLIPVNPTVVSFWFMVLVFGTLLLLILFGPYNGKISKRKNAVTVVFDAPSEKKFNTILLFPLIGIVFVVVALIFSSPVFHAANYASTIGEIRTTTFEEARPETNSVSNIALIDTATASRIGSRELGTLEDVVSQFVDGGYTQITYNGRVKKTAVVDYDGFFKYINNRKRGTPGYLIVDPINATAQLVRTQEGIRYTPGAFFSQDIRRHLRVQYPTLIFGETYFEIDENGAPYWITQVRRNRVFLMNPQNVGIIITDAITGSSEKYDISSVPEWVDTVFDGYYVCEKYDNYGMLSGGFWNSVFGKKGCRISTKCEQLGDDGDTHSASDFGYLADDKDIWIYTGVTSATSEDHSDIGMLMVNGRTGEVKYMTLAGADESSAMAAANGELQQYGYQASFPSIINVDGSPAYIMVMTDDNRIVKNYAMVNMQNYSQVVTGNTQNEVFRKYRRLVNRGGLGEGVGEGENGGEEQSLVADDKVLSAVYGSDDTGHYIELIMEDGSSVKYYMTD